MRHKSSQLKLGSFLAYAQMALSIIIGLSYTPIMIRLLGKSEYGLYNTVSSIISMLSILSLGFNSSYIRYYARYKKNDDIESINSLNGLFLIIFGIIGTIAFVCGIFLSFHLDLIFDKGLTNDEYAVARVLMILLTISLSISFPMSVFQNIISAHEKFIFLKLVAILKTIASPLVCLPLMLMGYKSIAIVSVTLLVQLVSDVIYIIYVIRRLNNKFYFYGFEKGITKDLFIYTSFIALNMIVDQINWNVDKMLLGRFKGTASVAVYSVGYSLHTHYNTFSKALSGLFTPRVHRIINKYSENLAQRNEMLTALFIKVGRIQYLILALIGSGLVFFGKQFITLWVGESYNESYYVALLLTLPSTVALIQNLGIEIQRAENIHKFRSLAYTVMAVINLVMSVFLCQKYGAVGAAAGTAFALIAANGFIMNIFYHIRCGVNIIEFWKNILSISKGLLIPVAIGFIIYRYWNCSSWIMLILGIVIYSLAYFLNMWFLGMNSYEKDLILSFRKVFSRKTSKKQV